MLIVGFLDSKEEKEANENTKTLAKAMINHSKELVQEVKPTINNYIEKHNKIDEIVISEDINEDEIYEQVEEDNKIKSTWAKALSQSDGDKDKAESLYIKLRVGFLVQEKKEQIKIEKKRIQEQEFILKQEEKRLKEEQEKLKEDYSLKKLDSFLSNYSVTNKIKINDSKYIIQLANSPIDIEIVFDDFEWKELN